MAGVGRGGERKERGMVSERVQADEKDGAARPDGTAEGTGHDVV